MDGDDFARLLQFYLACIQAEDRRSLTKRLDSFGASLVSPWEEEPLFHCGAAEVRFEVTSAVERKALLGGAALAGGLDRFYYGYPVFLDEEGRLSPLFVTQVEVEHLGESQFLMRRVEANEIELNHHLFAARGFQLEERRAIQEALEADEYASFANRLEAAFEAMGEPLPEFPPAPLAAFPIPDAPRSRWVNRPVLFKSERSPYTHKLARELEALWKYPRLRAGLPETAAGLLAGLASVKTAGRQSAPPLIAVQPLDEAQECAARQALEADLTVVTGPPGTGKSQLVVDVLASYALAGRPVLFASKNNKAVDVVRERLRAILGEDQDWTLRLGTGQVMRETRHELDGRLCALAGLPATPVPGADEFRRVDEEIGSVRRAIAELDAAAARCGELDRRRRRHEWLVDPAWVRWWGEWQDQPDCAWAERVANRADQLAGRTRFGLWLRLKKFFAGRWLDRRLREEILRLARSLPPQVAEDVRQPLAGCPACSWQGLADVSSRLARLARWRAAVREWKQALSALDDGEPAQVLRWKLDALSRQRAALDCARLRSGWTGRLAAQAAAVRHLVDGYFELSDRVRRIGKEAFRSVHDQWTSTVRELGRHLPVWIVTSLSARNALPLEPALFDLVVIDEASQCDIPSALPLLFRARRAVIIGDPQQLRHISTLSPAEEQELARQHGVEALLTEWSYVYRSLYLLAEQVALCRGQQPILLTHHYRCHPQIIEFSNQRFYRGRLVLRTDVSGLRQRLGGQPAGVFWHDVRGKVVASAHSALNQAELEAVMELLDEWAQRGFLFADAIDFGIVTPFRLQADRLDELICTRPWWERVRGRLSVGTAHRFQGDERDVMIFSPVVAEGMREHTRRWVAETEQLLNVAFTRARAALHVVGDLQACLKAGGVLAEFARTVADETAADRSGAIFDSPAEQRLAELLDEAGLWYRPQYRLGNYRLDFLVAGPSGARYDVEVDGRGHLTDAAIREDELRDAKVTAAGLKVVRVDAREIFDDPQAVLRLLRSLV